MPSDTIPPVQKPPVKGLRRIGRNGYPPDAEQCRRLIDFFHTNAGYRLKTLATFSMPYDYALNTETDTTVYRTLVHTSPNCSEVCMSLTLAPASSADTSSLFPTVYLVSKNADLSTQPATLTGVTTRATVSYLACDPATTLYPDSYIETESAFALSSDTTYALELHTSDKARVVACSIYERPRTTLNIASDVAVDASPVIPGGPILDVTANDLLTGAHTLWKRGGRRLFGWSAMDGGHVHSSGADYLNLFDQTVSGYDAAYPGWFCFSHYCGTLSWSSDPVKAWVYGVPISGTGAAKFISRSGTMCTITVAGSDAGYFSTDAYLATDGESDYVILDWKGDGDKGATLYSAGLYEYAD